MSCEVGGTKVGESLMVKDDSGKEVEEGLLVGEGEDVDRVVTGGDPSTAEGSREDGLALRFD